MLKQDLWELFWSLCTVAAGLEGLWLGVVRHAYPEASYYLIIAVASRLERNGVDR